jgi:pimeloyl-ACP methyl ester carboxylesterase
MFAVSNKTHSSTNKVLKNSRQSCKEIKLLQNKLIDKPLIVIAAGKWDGPRSVRQRFFAFQKNLCKLSNYGKLLIAEKSGHSIHHDQPEIIIDAIKQQIDNYKKTIIDNTNS